MVDEVAGGALAGAFSVFDGLGVRSTMLVSSVALFAGGIPRAGHAPRAGVRVVDSTPPPSRDATAPAPASHIPAPLADADTFLAAQEDNQRGGGKAGKEAGAEGGDARGNPRELSEEAQEVVGELKSRDREVRRHERAHAAAAGPYGGAPTFDYERGPDGRLYAVGGEVKIDVSPERDPAATIAKMEIVIRAALAPADPSAQDRAVAAQAKQQLQQARAELEEKKVEEQAGTSGPAGPPGAAEPDRAGFSRALGAYARTADVLSALAGAATAKPSLDLAA